MAETDSVEQRWLDTAGNREEWGRIERALALSRGFALFVVDVPDVATEDRIFALLSSRRLGFDELDAREDRNDAPVNVLLREQQRRYVIRTVEASRRSRDLFVQCLAQLNQRRDQIVERGHCVWLVVRRNEVNSLPDVAPDLYSIHRARFRLARLPERCAVPCWLVLDAEYLAALEGPAGFDARLSTYEAMLALSDEAWFEAFDVWAQGAAAGWETQAERMLCRWAGLACGGPHALDLAAALERPSDPGAHALLRSHGQSQSSRLAFVCASASAWARTQDAAFAEAEAAVEEAEQLAEGEPRLGLRARLLPIDLDRARGIFDRRSKMVDAIISSVVTDASPIAGTSARLFLAAVGWEQQLSPRSVEGVRVGLRMLESQPRARWLLGGQIRSLDRELLEAAVDRHARADTMTWLGDRVIGGDADWVGAWSTSLMLARASGEDPWELESLGQTWIQARTHGPTFEVWRALVELHSEAGDASKLGALVELALSRGASDRFAQHYGLALIIVAELHGRGLVDVAELARARLLEARAAELAPHARVGWRVLARALA